MFAQSRRLWSMARRSFLAALITMTALVAATYAQSGSIWDNPNARAVQEQQLLQVLDRIQGRGTLPDIRSNVLEQPAGRAWEAFHDRYLPWIGGTAILGICGLLVGFYCWRGPLRFGKRSGQTMPRFTAFERFVHWMTAVSFVALAVSGLNITFGKKLLLPLVGADAFSAWSQIAKFAHNYLSFPFTLGVVLMFLIWVANNLPTWADLEWMKRGGGMLGGEEPPAWRFNAGEKLIFWTVVVGGGTVSASGYLLLFPFYGTGVASMQAAQIVHSLVGVLYVAAMLVHTYMGTLGMEGAFEGMVSGEVDVNWAKVHHALWYDDEMVRALKDSIAAQPRAGLVTRSGISPARTVREEERHDA